MSCWHHSCSVFLQKCYYDEGDALAEKQLAESEEPAAAAQSNKSNSLLYGLLIVNMLVVIAVGLAAFLGKAPPDPLQAIAQGAQADRAADPQGLDQLIGSVVSLETFLVNLSGTDGNRLLKVNLDLEVSGEDVINEIEKRTPQIRDIVIILLSSKNYQEVATAAGKDRLRAEIKDTLNAFLTHGSVVNVLYTEFIFN